MPPERNAEDGPPQPPRRVRDRAVISLFDFNNEWVASGHINVPASGYVDVIVWGGRVFKVETPERYREATQTSTFVEMSVPA